MIIEFVSEGVNPVLLEGKCVVEGHNTISKWVSLSDCSLISEQFDFDTLLGKAIIVGYTQFNTQNQKVSWFLGVW